MKQFSIYKVDSLGKHLPEQTVIGRGVYDLHKILFLKLQSVAFFGLKIIQNAYLRKYITSQCSKLSACLSSIQNGKLVIMFLILVVMVDFFGRFEHVFASLRHICTHKEGVSASRFEDVGGGDYRLFSQHLI